MTGDEVMTIPAESIEIGKCYLAERRESPQVWRVVTVFPDGRVDYESRPLSSSLKQAWRRRMTTISLLAGTVTREVPCDWTPGADG